MRKTTLMALVAGLGAAGAVLFVLLSPTIDLGEIEGIRVSHLEGDLDLDRVARERWTDRLATAFAQQEVGRRDVSETAPIMTVVLIRSWAPDATIEYLNDGARVTTAVHTREYGSGPLVDELTELEAVAGGTG